jgi:hypothetical protein
MRGGCRPPAAPFHVALALTVPVVDLDRTDGRWNRTLTLLNCLLMPTWFVGATGYWQEPVPSEAFPLWALTLSIGFGLALLVLLTSRADRPPIYHAVRTRTRRLSQLRTPYPTLHTRLSIPLCVCVCMCVGLGGGRPQVFGFLAFPMSAVWLYAICGELISLLEVCPHPHPHPHPYPPPSVLHVCVPVCAA